MDLKRTIYKRMLDWKNDIQHSTLQISGARQAGKTYLINKFADENFAKKIYINLFELSGKQFLECYEQVIAGKTGIRYPEYLLHDAFKLYDIEFEDTDDTVIIIDEIQESAEIYNRSREFRRYFKAHFIVIVSYIGRIYDSEFRFSSGDVTKLTIYTMSFEEFLMVYDSQLYTKYCKMDQHSEEDIYDQLKDVYDIYIQIGGYPKVVETYLMKHSVKAAQEELVKIIYTFVNESVRYFADILDTRVFSQILLSVCCILNREKRG